MYSQVKLRGNKVFNGWNDDETVEGYGWGQGVLRGGSEGHWAEGVW